LDKEVAAVRAGTKEWLLIGYTDDRNGVSLQHSGSGGLSEMVSHLKPDNQFFGLLRYKTTSNSIKFVYVVWSGENVRALKRARVSTHKPAMAQILGQAHVTLSASTLAEISAERVLSYVTVAGGTQYDLGRK